MKGTIIYSVHGGEEPYYFTTKKEAIEVAKKVACTYRRAQNPQVAVELCVVRKDLGSRHLAISLISGGWCSHSVIIASFHGTMKEDE